MEKFKKNRAQIGNGTDRTDVDLGNGLVQTYASEEGKYEYRLENLEQYVQQIKKLLSALTVDQVEIRDEMKSQLCDFEDEINALKSKKKKSAKSSLFRKKLLEP